MATRTMFGGRLARLGGLGLAGMLVWAAAASRASAQVGVHGVAYAQYMYQFSDTANYNNFDVTRAYVNITGKFDHGVSTRITTDLYRNSDGNYNIRLKYAYVTFTPAKSRVSFRFGQTQTPWIDWEEGLWGYRMQGPIAVDRGGFLTSADLGLAVDINGKDNVANAQLALVNGEGYHSGEGDSHKDAEARVSVRLAKSDDSGTRGGLRLTVYGGVGAPTGGGVRDRAIGAITYKSSLVTLGGEYALASTRKGDATPSNPTVKAHIASFFGVLNVPKSNVGFIGRVDVVNPNTDATNAGHTIVIGGISYKISSNLLLLGDIDATSYQTNPTGAAYEGRTKGYFQVQFTY